MVPQGAGQSVQAKMDFKKQKNENSNLQDFKIVKMIGKGTFGKVFLVQHSKNKKFYAMKTLRKDIIIENDNLDSIKLEKEILYQVDHPFIVSMDYVF